MKKKATIVLTALALVLCFAIGGTLAWLVDETEAVVNTFTYGDINIELWENDYDPESGTLNADVTLAEQDDYKMVPGAILPKNPTVTVNVDSEACWLFVKIEKSDNFVKFMTFNIDSDWTPLEGSDDVYYIKIDAATAKTGVSYQVLNENQVTVLDSVTKNMMEEIKNEPDLKPTLTFTAYAVQSANLTKEDGTAITSAVDAWGLINN